jgi:hypothetical protein
LTLFLDLDGFNASSPQTTNDTSWWIPGALSTGVSVTPSQLPQRIRVVAAYVDASGTIVPPPETTPASMSLSNVSAFKGIAMNASKKQRNDDAIDLEVIDTSATFGATTQRDSQLTAGTTELLARRRPTRHRCKSGNGTDETAKGR